MLDSAKGPLRSLSTMQLAVVGLVALIVVFLVIGTVTQSSAPEPIFGGLQTQPFLVLAALAGFAGLMSFVSPCTLPILPAYFAFAFSSGRKQIATNTLFFMLGELPFITGLYERARRELGDDEHLTVDGVKELLLETRERYGKRFGWLARDLGPQTMSTYLKYVRNLSLIESRLTPDLYTLVVAAKQIAGTESGNDRATRLPINCAQTSIWIEKDR